MKRFHVSSFIMPTGEEYVSVVDSHCHSHIYYRLDTSIEARKFVEDYAKALNTSYKFMPEPFGNMIGGGGI